MTEETKTPSGPGPFEGYRAPLGIACPACKAPIGEHCRRSSGMFASWEHAARINALMWANARQADENPPFTTP